MRVIDACKQEKSIAFSVRIFPFVIQQEPPHVTRLFLGEVTTLSVVAIGETNLSYQWLLDGVFIEGATSTSITLDPFTWSMNGTRYTVLVEDGTDHLLSNPALIIAQSPPVIGALTPSTTQALFIGQSVDFSLTILDGISLNFTWFLGDEIIAAGGDANPITVLIASLDQDGAEVRVNVSNPNGYVLSSPYPITVEKPPAFSRPRARTVLLLLGEVYAIDMSREVLGNNVTSRWLRNNETIPGETTYILSLPPFDMTTNT